MTNKIDDDDDGSGDADYDVNIMMTIQGILVKDDEFMFSISFASSKGFNQDPYNWRAAKVMIMWTRIMD